MIYQLDNNIRLPIKVIVERRTSHRFSIAHKHAILRMPKWYPQMQRDVILIQFRDWIEKHYQANPDMFNRFRLKQYASGEQICLMGIDYTLDIRYDDKSTIRSKVDHRECIISISIPESTEDTESVVNKTLKKTIIKQFKPLVKQRIDYFATQLIGVEFNELRLKDSLSNWGSCSGKKNINIAIRSLLLPVEIMNYIFIHELCHLIELNHSPRFWKLVSDAMPDYKKAEQWIARHGNEIFF